MSLLRIRTPKDLAALPDPQTDTRWDIVLPSIGGYVPIPEEIDLPLPEFETDILPRGSREDVNLSFEKSVKFTITFYCDISMATMSWLDTWKKTQRNRENHSYGFPEDYKKKLVVYQYGLYGMIPVYRYDLLGVQCLGGERLKLQSKADNASRIRLTANFSADTVIPSPIMAGQVASHLFGGSLTGLIKDQAIANAVNWADSALNNIF